MKTLLLFAKLADRLLQRVVPVVDDRVAWVSDPDYIGNAFHLYRHVLETRPGRTHVWLINDHAAARRAREDLRRWGGVASASRVRIVRRHGLRGYWAFLRSAVVFHTHGVYRMTTTAHRRQLVSLWHGMPIKAIGALNLRSPDPHPTIGTLHVATSEMFRSIIAAAFRAPIDAVVLTGLPRCDVLTTPSDLGPSRDEVRSAMGVPEGRRFVMWMPTYRTAVSRATVETGIAGPQTFLDDLRPGDLDALAAAAERHGCTVIVKLHPYDPLNVVDHELGLDHVRLLRSHEYLETGLELYDVLAHTDGLISDVSSVLIDYLATDRPIGILGFDPDAYTRDVLIRPQTLIDSERIRDLTENGAIDSYFGAVAGDERDVDDLSPWLYTVERGVGCETVLRASGI